MYDLSGYYYSHKSNIVKCGLGRIWFWQMGDWNISALKEFIKRINLFMSLVVAVVDYLVGWGSKFEEEKKF